MYHYAILANPGHNRIYFDSAMTIACSELKAMLASEGVEVTEIGSKDSLPYLEEAYIDFATDRMGGQLTIKAPNAKVPKVSPDSPMNEQINYILYSEINPGLASHGGEVKLEDLIEDEAGTIAVLRFGGGCQGCSAVDMTLKDGVEKTLIERVPGLIGVRDATDHTVRENAYFK